MKKLFFLVAALCLALTIHATVTELDLSKAKSYSTAGGATLAYDEESKELTVNWEVTSGWAVSGIQISLRSLTGVTGIQFEFQGNGKAVDFLHYLTDEQGTYWWDANGQESLASTDWKSFSVTPYKALWQDNDPYEYGTSSIVAIQFVANPSTATTGTFKIRNVRLITSGEGPIDPNPEGKSLPLTYNGEILPINMEFTRTMSGQIGAHIGIPEVRVISGWKAMRLMLTLTHSSLLPTKPDRS
jgi:hypothetical protein